MNKVQVNQALALMVVAGEKKDFIDGVVYAHATSLGVSEESWYTALEIALMKQLIEPTETYHYRTTPQGRVLARQVREFYKLTDTEVLDA